LTLARLPRDARYAVIEIGMNHAGEIAPLATMARPHAAIVTAVEPAHLAFFDSLRDIAAEKASIVRGVVPDGTFVIPADNAEIETLRKVGQAAGVATIVTFGAHEDANLRLVDAAVNLSGTQVVAEIDGARLHYDIGIAGRHVALNSLAAVAAGRALGADVGAFVAHLALLRPTPGRGDRRTVAAPGGPITVIDESYNASPAAVLAVAEAMAAAPRAAGMRLILVLGDMLELGVDAAKLHAGLAPRLAELRIDSVYTAGPLMENLHLALPKAMRGGHARDSLALTALVSAALRPGDVVAVKGSHGSNMKPVVEAIAALGAGSPPARAAHGH
jgi:UDP-N-acetylmuramoyl-tripeptide--D-alanyl-D-alanine ligase